MLYSVLAGAVALMRRIKLLVAREFQINRGVSDGTGLVPVLVDVGDRESMGCDPTAALCRLTKVEEGRQPLKAIG